MILQVFCCFQESPPEDSLGRWWMELWVNTVRNTLKKEYYFTLGQWYVANQILCVNHQSESNQNQKEVSIIKHSKH